MCKHNQIVVEYNEDFSVLRFQCDDCDEVLKIENDRTFMDAWRESFKRGLKLDDFFTFDCGS